jgi:hypothetical protein
VAESKEEAKGRKRAAKKSISAKSRTGGGDTPDPREGAAATAAAQGTVANADWMVPIPRLPWAGKRVPFTEPILAMAGGVVEPVTPPSPPDPTHAPVDRSVHLSVFTVDVPQEDGSIWKRPYDYPSGPAPADPAAFQPVYDTVGRVCHVLAPGAAMRCAAWGRYG